MRHLAVSAIGLLGLFGTMDAAKTVYIPSDYNNYWSDHYCNTNGQNGTINSLDDLKDPNEKWCKTRSYETDNIICLWEAGFGTDPTKMKNPADESQTFDLTKQMAGCEEILKYHIDSLKATYADGENLNKYKILFMLYYTTEWMAYGSGVDYTIGAMWVNPAAIGVGSSSDPYYVLAHELFHAMSYQAYCDKPSSNLNAFQDSYNGAFWEICAQHAAMDIYPNQSEYFDNYMFMNSYHGLSTRKHYAPSFMLDELDEYVGSKSALGSLWTSNVSGEHAYNTVTNTFFNGDWSAMCDFAGKAAMHTVAMDYEEGSHGLAMKSVRATAQQNDYSGYENSYAYYDVIKNFRAVPYAVDYDKRHFAIRDCQAPQDFGFNAIQLFPEHRESDGSATIRMRFRGHTGGDNSKNAGWRWGFVAVDNNGASRFGTVYSDTDRVVSFDVEAADKEVWLVVTGTPSEFNDAHYYSWEAGFPKYYRYPYEFRLENAVPMGYNADWEGAKSGGAYHSNGGGWVASTASVAATAYVGPNAKVLGHATVSGNARIEDFAVVKGYATVSDNAVVNENALVYGNAAVSGNAVVSGEARVLNGSKISGNAFVTDNVFLQNTSVTDNAVACGNMFVNSYATYELSNTAIVGGDIDTYDENKTYEGTQSISSGTCLQVPSSGNNNRSTYDGSGNLSSSSISSLTENWNDVKARLTTLSNSISSSRSNPNYDINLTGLYSSYYDTDTEINLPVTGVDNLVSVDNMQVFTSGHQIFVKGASVGARISLYGVNGQLVADKVADADVVIFDVNLGTYIVVANGEAHKVVLYR